MRQKPTPADWKSEIDAWAVAMRAAGFTGPSITTRTDHLRRCARALGQDRGPWEVTSEDLVAWTGEQNWARATRRSMRASLIGFWRWGFGTHRTDHNPAEALPRVQSNPPEPRPTPEHIYEQALANADERGQLILRLAAEAGLRRAEIAVIHSRDLVQTYYGHQLIVHGKGQRDRTVPLSADLARMLKARGEGWAFPGDDGGHLSPRWVGKMATRLLPGDWTLHSLRHRYATAAYAGAQDLLAVQQLLGHSTPTTTQLYVVVPDDSLRRAAAAAARGVRRAA